MKRELASACSVWEEEQEEEEHKEEEEERSKLGQ